MSNTPITLGSHADVAIVDFGPFLDGSDKQGVADAMLTSFKEVGFVYLVNHSLDKEKSKSESARLGLSCVMDVLSHAESNVHHRYVRLGEYVSDSSSTIVAQAYSVIVIIDEEILRSARGN